MDAHEPNRADKPPDTQLGKLFSDLRGRNERRANLARLLDSQRRARIERATQAARQHRFRHRPRGSSGERP